MTNPRLSQNPRRSACRSMLPSGLALGVAMLVGGIAAPSLAQDAAPPAANGTPIIITIGETVMYGRLNTTTVARNLEERLPMTVTFGHHPNGGDYPTKVTHLDPPLSTEGTDLGAAPGPGHIALYVPSGNLGLYYDQLSYWGGAVILGDFTGDLNLIAKQAEDFTVTIEVE